MKWKTEGGEENIKENDFFLSKKTQNHITSTSNLMGCYPDIPFLELNFLSGLISWAVFSLRTPTSQAKILIPCTWSLYP